MRTSLGLFKIELVPVNCKMEEDLRTQSCKHINHIILVDQAIVVSVQNLERLSDLPYLVWKELSSRISSGPGETGGPATRNRGQVSWRLCSFGR